MIIVTGDVLAKADTIDEALRVAQEHVARSRTEPGCMSHDVFRDPENPLRLFFYERWADEAALKAHFAVPASRQTVKSLNALAAQTSGVQIFRAEALKF